MADADGDEAGDESVGAVTDAESAGVDEGVVVEAEAAGVVVEAEAAGVVVEAEAVGVEEGAGVEADVVGVDEGAGVDFEAAGVDFEAVGAGVDFVGLGAGDVFADRGEEEEADGDGAADLLAVDDPEVTGTGADVGVVEGGTVKYTDVGTEPNEGAAELGGTLLNRPAALLRTGPTWLLLGTWPVPATCGTPTPTGAPLL